MYAMLLVNRLETRFQLTDSAHCSDDQLEGDLSISEPLLKLFQPASNFKLVS